MANKKQEIKVGTLYELNQQILNQLPAQPQEHLQRQFGYINNANIICYYVERKLTILFLMLNL